MMCEIRCKNYSKHFCCCLFSSYFHCTSFPIILSRSFHFIFAFRFTHTLAHHLVATFYNIGHNFNLNCNALRHTRSEIVIIIRCMYIQLTLCYNLCVFTVKLLNVLIWIEQAKCHEWNRWKSLDWRVKMFSELITFHFMKKKKLEC